MRNTIHLNYKGKSLQQLMLVSLVDFYFGLIFGLSSTLLITPKIATVLNNRDNGFGGFAYVSSYPSMALAESFRYLIIALKMKRWSDIIFGFALYESICFIKSS